MTRMDVREKLVDILKQAPFEGKVLDEWLPSLCELQEACPHPCGVACWEQYLKYKDRKEETLKKYGFTLEAKYKEA